MTTPVDKILLRFGRRMLRDFPKPWLCLESTCWENEHSSGQSPLAIASIGQSTKNGLTANRKPLVLGRVLYGRHTRKKYGKSLLFIAKSIVPGHVQ